MIYNVSRVTPVALFNAVYQLVTNHIVNVMDGSYVVSHPSVKGAISMANLVFTLIYLRKVSSIGFMIGSK